ncbi:MAG: GyrI-like domain-containing protein [Spirochaetaceae bacterium]|nr:GyrI-like domain-containing protein [Spirochaetaceae bacterium]
MPFIAKSGKEIEVKCLYKDNFTVMGMAGEGPMQNPSSWIKPLWELAAANKFAEIDALLLKNPEGKPLFWGAMAAATQLKEGFAYLAGGEVAANAKAPIGWEKWQIPAQSYVVAAATMDDLAEVCWQLPAVLKDEIVGPLHEFYPNPDNPNIIDVYIPIAKGKLKCKACEMEMLKPEDFGTEANGLPSRTYCRYCRKD